MRCRAKQIHLQVCRARPTVLQNLEQGRAHEVDSESRCSFARVEGLPVLYAHLGCSQTLEPLLLYLAATNQVVSAALVAQREVDEAKSEQRPAESEKDQDSNEHGNESNPKDVARKKVVQRLVYFVSSLLQGAGSRYSGVQKLIFGLIMASRKLHHNFQAH